MPLFTGRFEYSVDDKGRLSVPARLREQVEVEGQETSFIITCLNSAYLSIYAPTEFQSLIDAISQSTDAHAREALRLTTSGAETCPLDKQGRVMLPPALRLSAGIGRDVVILGVARRIEVWDRAREAAHRRETADSGARLLAGLKVPSDLI
ncbi:MAG TPA: cell division/cell wall cluster transcriptional repressor MraZ [bacterium]|jgi:MraZ protein|nr:cell division/cell wall cluster transcriptional repressor MraZ [bacterium]